MTRALFCLAILIVETFLGNYSQSFAADKITLSSTNPTAFDIDFVVAKDKGFFASENLDVDATYMTPDLVIKALIAGTVDLARSGTETRGLPGLMQEMREGGAKHKTKGVLEGAREKVGDILQGGRDGEEPQQEPERPRHGSRPAARRERQERER